MSQPLISVLMTTYNHEKYITESIDSITNQTYENLELIIINDGSTDKTEEKIQPYLENKKVKYINQANTGPSIAFNNGLKESKGDYIALMSGDDISYTNRLEEQLSILIKENMNICFSYVDIIDDNSDLLLDHPLNNIFNKPGKKQAEIIRYFFEIGNYLNAPSALIKRHVLNEANTFNPCLLQLQDYDLWIRLIKKNKFYTIQKPLVKYRVRANNTNLSLSEGSSVRLANEQYLIFQTFFDEMPIDLFREAFQDKLIKKNFSAEEFECEKAFIYLNLNNFLRNGTKLIGIEKIFKLLSYEKTSEILKEKYNFTNKSFTSFLTAWDFLGTDLILKERENELLSIKNSFSFNLGSKLTLNFPQLENIIKSLQKIKWTYKQEGCGGLGRGVLRRLICNKYYNISSFIERIYIYREIGYRLIKNDLLLSDNWGVQKWLLKNYPSKAIINSLKKLQSKFNHKPLISIILPIINNSSPEFIEQCFQSVFEQVYGNWELCVLIDNSDKKLIQSILKKYYPYNKKIKTIFSLQNQNISEASNSLLSLSQGDYIIFLNHHDIFSPDALFEIVSILNKSPEAEMIYSDQGIIDKNNKVINLFFKPDFCPESLLSRAYVNYLTAYKKEILNKIGDLRTDLEDSQDYDLALRTSELTNNIFHVCKVLYYQRNTHLEEYTKNTEKVLKAALERRNEKGNIVPISTNHQIVRFEITDYKKVSIIIPTRDFSDILERCLQSVFTISTYPNYEVLIIDNGSQEHKTFELFDEWKKKYPEKLKIYTYDIPFNYSKLNNYAVSKAEGDFLLFLNNDTEVISNDWMEAMMEYCQKDFIGAVGALLLYPDNTVQHAGVVCVGGLAGHGHKHFSKTDMGYFGALQTVNNYSAVTAACLMCRKEVFEKVSGFEEDLAVAFNDVDFCFKLLESGFRNVYLPHVQLYHHESKSRGAETTPEKKARFQEEVQYMQQKWEHIIKNDTCYNPNLVQSAEDFSIN